MGQIGETLVTSPDYALVRTAGPSQNVNPGSYLPLDTALPLF